LENLFDLSLILSTVTALNITKALIGERNFTICLIVLRMKTDCENSSDLSPNLSGNLLVVEHYNRICL